MTDHTHPDHHLADINGRFIWSGLVAIMGLVALFVAAGAKDAFSYYGGLAFFTFAVLFAFLMIKRGYDKAEGLASTGLPVAVRVFIAGVIGYIVHGATVEAIPGQASLAGVVAAVVVFAVLAYVNRVAIRGE